MAIKIASQDVHADGTLMVPNKLGIKTNTPLYPLHVEGAIYASAYSFFPAGLALSSTQGFSFLENGVYVGNKAVTYDSNTNTVIFGGSNIHTSLSALASLKFSLNSNEYMRIASSGNVGIGTTTPSSKLDVAGNIYTSTMVWNAITASNGSVVGDTDSNGTLSLADASRYLTFGTVVDWSASMSTAPLLALKSSVGSKNVGIGFIHGNSSDVLRAASNLTSTGYSSGSVNSMVLGYVQNGPRIFISDYDIAAQTIYQNSIRLTCDFAIITGKVGIGDSTNYWSASPSYQLALTSDSAAKPTSNTWTISSDARVKTILGNFTRGLSDIIGLEPKRYRLNGEYGTIDDGREHVSVIAQDLQETWPEMIGEYTYVAKDSNSGLDITTTLFSLNTNDLQWALVNAIKELTERVVTLEQAVA